MNGSSLFMDIFIVWWYPLHAIVGPKIVSNLVHTKWDAIAAISCLYRNRRGEWHSLFAAVT